MSEVANSLIREVENAFGVSARFSDVLRGVRSAARITLFLVDDRAISGGAAEEFEISDFFIDRADDGGVVCTFEIEGRDGLFVLRVCPDDSFSLDHDNVVIVDSKHDTSLLHVEPSVDDSPPPLVRDGFSELPRDVFTDPSDIDGVLNRMDADGASRTDRGEFDFSEIEVTDLSEIGD